jgi:2,3-bisphosphoglycerate-dependent phosphoglycerate mutase
MKRSLILSVKKQNMRFFVVLVSLLCLSCGHTYYVARHAEKEDAGPNMSGDVPLTRAGRERAEQLKEILKKEHIRNVFSTDYIRTKSTAQRTADYFNLPVILYGPRMDSAFMTSLRALRSNALIVGHSNTVDDIVNALCGEKKVSGDLPDSEYNKLYEIRVKGRKVYFKERPIFP